MSKRENKPSLGALSFALRHPELWPADFGEWDYSNCSHCGMGLAKAMWPKQIREANQASMREAFDGLTHYQANRIFGSAAFRYGCSTKSVTAEQVANLIDELGP